MPFYLISLIGHKLKVDYNVVMQMLRYMVCIWEEYEKETDKRHKGSSKRKDFKYPLILPIVFYDGIKNWTASLNLSDRIESGEDLQKYIPDFQCLLIRPRDYSNVQLMERNDILSFIMMIDKVQSKEDLRHILNDVPKEYMDTVMKDTPEELKDIAADMIDLVTAKANVPEEERDVLRGYVKENKMGELFSHMKGYDIQATRAEARAQEREAGIEKLIKAAVELGADKEKICQQLMKQYELTESEATEKVKLYWS